MNKIYSQLVFTTVLLTLLMLSPSEVQAQPYNCTTDQSQIATAECEALVALYTNTNGGSWTDNTGWLVDSTPCTWFGVSCEDTPTGSPPKTVISLVQFNNNLTGTLPSTLANLSSLDNLRLDVNNLSGPIPPTWGGLANLRIFQADRNQLTGALPPELGNLDRLELLALFGNDLSGPLPPTMFAPGNLPNLTRLLLGDNQFTGSIPAALSNLANLENLYLGLNNLTGPIPPSLGTLANLEVLRLDANDLSGPIPPELGNLANLRFLLFDRNQLSGPIPPELGTLTNLETLDLFSNALTGTIPPALRNLTNLKRLLLLDNALTGGIPTFLCDLTNLEALTLGLNPLGGMIPPCLGTLPNLIALRIDAAQLTGELPASLGNLAPLEVLQLDRNELTGAIPTSFDNLVALNRLILSSNQLTGTVPLGVAQIGAGIEAAGGLCNLQLNAGLCIPDTAPYQAIGADPICRLPLDATCSSPTFADYDIYAYGGSTTTRVTFLNGTGEFNPDWAPFGAALVHDVVTFATDGNTFASQDLYLTAPAFGSAPLTGAEGGNDAAWAPFGFLIAFDRAPFGAPGSVRDETLYLVPVWGGSRIPIRPDAVDPAWSPSGRYLTFQQPSDGSIRALDLFTGREVVVANTGANPVWSPNGQWIAYADGGDIYRVRVRRNGQPLAPPQQVTTDPANDSQPAWTPNSRRLLFHSDRSGDFDLYAILANGSGTATRVTGLAGPGDFDPDVSRSGLVAYAGFTEPTASLVTKSETWHPEAPADTRYLNARAEAFNVSAMAKHYDLSAWTDALGDKTMAAYFTDWLAAAQNDSKREDTAMTPSVEEAHAVLETSSYPNPFNPATTISFTLPEASPVTLKVFDLLGRVVATLAQETLEAGVHTVQFDASYLPSGTYFYRLEAGTLSATKQLTVLK